MKTPLLLGRLCVEDTPTSAAARQAPSPGGVAYAVCEQCNLQLTSAAQVRLHYAARSHLRRVRRLGGAGQATHTGRAPWGASGLHLDLKAPVSTLDPDLHPHAPASGVHLDPDLDLQPPAPAPGLHLDLDPDLRPPAPASGLNLDLQLSSRGAEGGGRGLWWAGPHSATVAAMMATKPLATPPALPSAASLFPNFNTMDPVQRAVISHTFGVSMATKRKQVISCPLCQLRFNSDSQAHAHYRGSRHAKKLKSQLSVRSGSAVSVGPAPLSAERLRSPKSTSSSSSSSSSPLRASLLSSNGATGGASLAFGPPPAPLSSSSSPALPPQSKEEQEAQKLLFCSLCKVSVNSESQLDAHNAGSKHRTMLEARLGSGPIRSFPRPGAKLRNGGVAAASKGSGLQDKTFHCQICDVHVNSEIQLKQHITSRRHKDKVAGKLSRPKYSPYSRQPEPLMSPASLSVPSSPLPSSLSSLPVSVHPRPPPVSLSPVSVSPVSSPLFAVSLMRPAPGPLRTSQGSVLFGPY